MKALLLLSGGMDSSTLLYYLKTQLNYHSILALTLDYGQRHVKEVEAAKAIAEMAGCEWRYISAPLTWVDAPLMATSAAAIPEQAELKQAATVVPARNAYLLSIAAGVAIQGGYHDIHFASVMEDFVSYPDCRSDFTNHLSIAFQVAYGVSVNAIFSGWSKQMVVLSGLQMQVPYYLSWSCYLGGDKPCLRCDACVERQIAFAHCGRDYYGRLIETEHVLIDTRHPNAIH